MDGCFAVHLTRREGLAIVDALSRWISACETVGKLSAIGETQRLRAKMRSAMDLPVDGPESHASASGARGRCNPADNRPAGLRLDDGGAEERLMRDSVLAQQIAEGK